MKWDFDTLRRYTGYKGAESIWKKTKKTWGLNEKKSVTAGDWRCKKAGVCARQHFSLFQKRNSTLQHSSSLLTMCLGKKDANDRQWMLVCNIISTPSETHGLSRVFSRKHRNWSKSSSDDSSKRKNTFFIKWLPAVFFKGRQRYQCAQADGRNMYNVNKCAY